MMRRREVKSFISRDDIKSREAHHKKPKAQEEKMARSLNGRTTWASGSLEHDKGDVEIEGELFDFLVECKRSTKRSLGIKAAWLNKITSEAEPFKTPLLAIQFDEKVIRELWSEQRARGRVEAIAEADWVAMPLSALRRLLACIGQECPDLEGDNG